MVDITSDLLAVVNSQAERIEYLESKLRSQLSPTKTSMDDDRRSITHEFTVGTSGIGTWALTVGFYSNGKVGEIFLEEPKGKAPVCLCDDPEHEHYSFVKGILRQFAISISVGLQWGVPIEDYIEKFKWCRFPPEGITKNESIRIATSIIDYVFRYIESLLKRESSATDSPI